MALVEFFKSISMSGFVNCQGTLGQRKDYIYGRDESNFHVHVSTLELLLSLVCSLSRRISNSIHLRRLCSIIKSAGLDRPVAGYNNF